MIAFFFVYYVSFRSEDLFSERSLVHHGPCTSLYYLKVQDLVSKHIGAKGRGTISHILQSCLTNMAVTSSKVNSSGQGNIKEQASLITLEI